MGSRCRWLAESTFASMPSIPTKSDNKLESSGLNASGFFNSEDSDAAIVSHPRSFNQKNTLTATFAYLAEELSLHVSCRNVATTCMFA